jgi:Holliday junction resolvase RusA-like endonuclease
MANRGPPGDRIHLGPNAARSIDEYWEYTRIVGNDDGGKTFTPEEYEKYKREVLPMVKFFFENQQTHLLRKIDLFVSAYKKFSESPYKS